MGRARSAARAALLHLNIALAVFAGGMLVTCARLSWDPTLYVAVRELWPLEYRALLAALCAAAVAQLLLAHLGAAAATGSAGRRCAACMLWTYACGSLSLVTAACGAACWLAERVRHWLRSPDAERVRRLAELPAKLQPALEALADWVPHVDTVGNLVQEAEANLPKNAHAAAAAAAVYVTAALAAAALAAALAVRGRRVRGERSYRGLAEAPRTMMSVRTLAEP